MSTLYRLATLCLFMLCLVSNACASGEATCTLVDMRNPHQMLSGLTDPSVDKEVFQIAGDPDHGMALDVNLKAGMLGRAVCFYELAPGFPVFPTIDVYQMAPDQPLLLHMFCPHCAARNQRAAGSGNAPGGTTPALHVRGEAKAIAYDAKGPMVVFPGFSTANMMAEFPRGLGGTLSVDTPFGCTWDVDVDLKHKVGPVCDFQKVTIRKNVLRRG